MSNNEEYNISQSGIPIVVVGRGAQVMIELVRAIQPEYDVIHTCVEIDTAIEELPELLSGSHSILPASNIGTNISRAAGETRPLPRAVLIGGGVSPEHYEQIQKAVRDRLGREAPEGCHWLKSTREHYPPDHRAGEPPLELIIQVARGLLAEGLKRSD